MKNYLWKNVQPLVVGLYRENLSESKRSVGQLLHAHARMDAAVLRKRSPRRRRLRAKPWTVVTLLGQKGKDSQGIRQQRGGIAHCVDGRW